MTNIKKLHIVAFILARKGSNRLRNKNLKNIIGKTSLVENTIKFAKKLNFVDNIVLSSDHKKIHKIGKKENILSPGLRPKHLSGNNISSEKVVIHLLNWYEQYQNKIDGILLLQPTTPYRNISLFNKAYKMFLRNKNSIIGVTKIFKNPKNFYYGDRNLEISKNLNKKKIFFFIDGSLFLIQKNLFLEKKKFVTKNFYPIINEKIKYSLDIDHLHELKLARMLRQSNF